MPRCSIVIPVFNQAIITRRCLASVLDHARPEDEIIVVDDGSEDLTPRLLESYGDRLTVVRHGSPAGYAGACNAGAARASSDHLVFLNNDTVGTDGWLEQLLDHAARHPRAAMVGTKLLYGDHTIQHAGVVISRDRLPYHIYRGFPSDHPVVNVSRPFQAVTAACVLVRRQLFWELGAFDTEFRNGYEDIDLSLRAGAAGYEIRYCHQSVVFHLEAATRNWQANHAHNTGRFMLRWGQLVQPDDVDYYVRDGLIQLWPEGDEVVVEISPLLGRAQRAGAANEAERMLDLRARQLQALRAEARGLRGQLNDAANQGLSAASSDGGDR